MGTPTKIHPEGGFLTDNHRGLLKSHIKNTRDSTQMRYRIRGSVRQALRDFRFLQPNPNDASYGFGLRDRDRELIFDVGPGTEEHRELLKDAQAAVAFLYAGLGGESDFRRALAWGVQQGEVTLGNADYAMDVEVGFDVTTQTYLNEHEAAAAIQNEEWDRLNPADLAQFVRVAQTTGAIDWDAFRSADRGPRSNTRMKARELKKEREEQED